MEKIGKRKVGVSMWLISSELRAFRVVRVTGVMSDKMDKQRKLKLSISVYPRSIQP